MMPRVCVLSHSVVSDSLWPWTVALQTPLSMGFSRQEDWSGLPCPSSRGSSRPWDGTLVSCISRVFTIWASKEAKTYVSLWMIHIVVGQKPVQHRKAIILQWKINNNNNKKDTQEKEKQVYLAWKNTWIAAKLEEIASGSRAPKAGRKTQSPSAFSPHPSFIFA